MSNQFVAPIVALEPRVRDVVKGLLLASVFGALVFVTLAWSPIKAYLTGGSTDLELAQGLLEPTVWSGLATVLFELGWVGYVVLGRGSGDFSLDVGLAFRPRDIYYGFLGWLADVAGGALLYGVLLPLISIQALEPEPFDRLVRYTTISPVLKIVMLVTIGLLVPVAEEMLFRGLLLGAFSRWMGPITGIALSSVVFGVLHAGSWTARDLAFVVWTTWAGLVFGVMRVLTGRIGAPIVAHGIHNSLIILLTVVAM